MFKKLLLIVATTTCTLHIQANDLANVTYTGTANNVSLAARIVPAQEAINTFGYDIHALNVTPVSFVITNHNTTPVLVSKNAIAIQGDLDANDSFRFIYSQNNDFLKKNGSMAMLSRNECHWSNYCKTCRLWTI
jgi:hypothetical protein